MLAVFDLAAGSGLFEERAVFWASRAAVRSRRVVTVKAVRIDELRRRFQTRGGGGNSTGIYEVLADARIAFFFSFITLGERFDVIISPAGHCSNCIWALN